MCRIKVAATVLLMAMLGIVLTTSVHGQPAIRSIEHGQSKQQNEDDDLVDYFPGTRTDVDDPFPRDDDDLEDSDEEEPEEEEVNQRKDIRHSQRLRKSSVRKSNVKLARQYPDYSTHYDRKLKSGGKGGLDRYGRGDCPGLGGSKSKSKSKGRVFLDPDREPRPYINCIPLPANSRSSKGSKSRRSRRNRMWRARGRTTSDSRRDRELQLRATWSGKGDRPRNRNRSRARGVGNIEERCLPYCPTETQFPTILPTVTPIPTFTPLPSITPFPSFTPIPSLSPEPTISSAPSLSSAPSISGAPSASSAPSPVSATTAPTPSASLKTSAPTPSASLTTTAPTPSASLTTPAPTPSSSTTAPTPSTTAATTTIAPTMGSTTMSPGGPTTRTVPARLGYGFFGGTTIRQPTTDEMNGLFTQTEMFYSDLLMAQYPTFTGFTMTNIVETFDAAANLPVIYDFDAEVTFSGGDTSSPTVAEIFTVMDNADLQTYIMSYVWNAAPVGTSLFMDTQRTSFGARGQVLN